MRTTHFWFELVGTGDSGARGAWAKCAGAKSTDRPHARKLVRAPLNLDRGRAPPNAAD